MAERLLSGKIVVENNEEFVETIDGRRIAFPFLSSGQQELLPLWLTVNQFFDGASPNRFVYIEEPEAHLFPSAQSLLIEYLMKLLGISPGQKMLITTHSPYLLAQINNLMKAGALAKTTPRKNIGALDKIVSSEARVDPRTVAAYAIHERKVFSILGDDGLIDGDYLDMVSNEISAQFNDLLEFEFAK